MSEIHEIKQNLIKQNVSQMLKSMCLKIFLTVNDEPDIPKMLNYVGDSSV